MQGVPRRYRAGLGPFGPDPVVVQATQEQADALLRDPHLGVTVIPDPPVKKTAKG